jgi:hypothetical protein
MGVCEKFFEKLYWMAYETVFRIVMGFMGGEGYVNLLLRLM